MDDTTAAVFPEFFERAPRIVVSDPLAAFLGAAKDGVIEYRYADAVRLAGHSCPTVASAFLMARAALASLYPDRLPERGGVRVQLAQDASEGVTGVIGNVIALVTGAAGDGGFHGIGPHFDRRGLLTFGAAQAQPVTFTRIDTGAQVSVAVRAELVPGDPRLRELLPRCVAGTATPSEAAEMRELWQQRVRRLLLEHCDDPQVVLVQRMGLNA